MKRRIQGALIVYLILIAIACVTLHGKMLAGVLILFAGLILKTLIAWKAGWRVRD